METARSGRGVKAARAVRVKKTDIKVAGKATNQSLADRLKNIGSKYKGAGDEVRTVSKSEFERLKNELLRDATKLPKDTNSNYSGTWYQLPNGQGRVGVRNSPKNRETLDFSGVNGLDKGFRIHQQ